MSTRGIPYARGKERGRRRNAAGSYLIQLNPIENARVQDAAIRAGLSTTRFIIRVVLRALRDAAPEAVAPAELRAALDRNSAPVSLSKINENK